MKPERIITPEAKPNGPDDRRRTQRRKADRWVLTGNRVWLALITGLWLWVAITLWGRQNQYQNSRIEGRTQVCNTDRTMLRVLAIVHDRKFHDKLAAPVQSALNECEAGLRELRQGHK